MTLSNTVSVVMLNIKCHTSFIILNVLNAEYYYTQCHYAESYYAECHLSERFTLSRIVV
jgi:hypothetical protein